VEIIASLLERFILSNRNKEKYRPKLSSGLLLFLMQKPFNVSFFLMIRCRKSPGLIVQAMALSYVDSVFVTKDGKCTLPTL